MIESTTLSSIIVSTILFLSLTNIHQVQAFSLPFSLPFLQQIKSSDVNNNNNNNNVCAAAVVDAPTTTTLCFQPPTTIKTTATISNGEQIRYLGKGKNAIIRPGVVLLAPKKNNAPVINNNHQYRRAAIFIYDVGLNEQTGEYVTRGVVLDHPTPFTIGEIADSSSMLKEEQGNGLYNNVLFKGGGCAGNSAAVDDSDNDSSSSSNDSAMLLHNQQHIGDGNMIGTSGIYQGGLSSALNSNFMMTSTDERTKYFQENFKFFFDYCEFTDVELVQMISGTPNSEKGKDDNDSWISIEVPPRLILADWGRGKAWKELRKAVAPYWEEEKSQQQPQEQLKSP